MSSAHWTAQKRPAERGSRRDDDGRERHRGPSRLPRLPGVRRSGWATAGALSAQDRPAAFGDERELLVLLPRGNGKSMLIGTLAVHHLLTTSTPAVYVAAASRDQARVVFEYARDVAMHPSIGDALIS